MTRSFQAPERIGAKELEEMTVALTAHMLKADMSPEKAKGTTDHDGDGKMGGVKGRKPKAKRGKS